MTLKEWLQSLDSVDTESVKTVTVKLGRQEFHGCRYFHGEPFQEFRYYLLGELPKSYTRRRKTVYVTDKLEWFIGSWLHTVTDQNKEYHPFGTHFLLMLWPNEHGAIDRYDSHPYTRLPMTVTEDS